MKKITFAILLLAACSKEESSQPETGIDYLVFGYFRACIGGRCNFYYKLTSKELYADQKRNYPSGIVPYEGNYVLLNDSLFELVKDLDTKVPLELIATKDHLIGPADQADGGGIYIEIFTRGKICFWLIGRNTRYVPSYLIPFLTEVDRDIRLINN